MPNEKSTGTNFLTRSFLRNQQLANSVNQRPDNTMSNVAKFAQMNINVLKSLDKKIESLGKIITSSNAKSTKDFVRRKDPFETLIKEVDDLEELQKEQLKETKKKNQSNLKGLLGLLGGLAGAAIGIGGLGGYLLTGKKDFLFSVLKGITKYSPLKFLLKGFDSAIKGLGKPIASGLFKVFSGVFKGGGKILSPLIKNLDFLFKPIMSLGKGLTTAFKPLGNLFGKIGGKALSKGGGKAFLKKVPIVGGLLGLFFGIQRFKKGQYVEGLLEVASGVASIVPGIGTALSIGIDSLLLFKDFTGMDMTAGVTGAAKKVGTGAVGLGKSAIKKIAGIGPIAEFIEGVGMWKTNKIGAIKKIGGAITSITPIGIIGKFISLIDHFVKEKGGIKEAAGAAIGTMAQAAKHPVKTAMSIARGAVGGAKKAYGKASGAVKSAASFGTEAAGAVSQMVGGLPSGLVLDRSGANIWGLRPEVREALFAAADEHMRKTGSPLQINSAFRSISEQKKLFESSKPGFAARPGRSPHNFGYAVDIQTKGATGIKDVGILKKFGFNRPIEGKEPWHFEFSSARPGNASPTVADTPKEEVGDPIVSMNLPNVSIPRKISPNANPSIDLSQSTITMLAEQIGKSFKGALPTSINRPINVETQMRG